MYYLIVKTSSIGDIIQTFPVVEYLKSQDSSCQIDWVVEEEYASLLRAHPLIDEVLTVSTRRWRKFLFQNLRQSFRTLRKKSYDVVFDLQGNTKSALLTSQVRSSQKVGFGRESLPEWPNYLVTHFHFNVPKDVPIQERYLSIVQQFFKDSRPFTPKGVELRLSAQDEEKLLNLRREGGRKIMVAFASKWENKTLSDTSWDFFLKRVADEAPTIFYFVSGSAKEKEKADRLANLFTGSLSLHALSFPLWQRLMSEMDLVIAVDSAALALCGTTKTTSFSIFGPTVASVYRPLGKNHVSFQGTCPYQVTFSARCPKLRTCSSGACLKQVSDMDLLGAYVKDCAKM